MAQRITAAHTFITNENMQCVAQELATRRGTVVIAQLAYWGKPSHLLTGDFGLHVVDSPTLKPRKKELETPTPHGGTTHKTNSLTPWEKSRTYRLAPTPKPSSNAGDNTTRGWFQTLQVGDRYMFDVHGHFCTGYALDESHRQFWYVPPTASPASALTAALTWMTEKWNAQEPKWRPGQFQFTTQHIIEIVAYALEDLRTGEAFRHNIQAGQDADAAVGIPLS